MAARGLAIPGVAHVINYDMTDDVDEPQPGSNGGGASAGGGGGDDDEEW